MSKKIVVAVVLYEVCWLIRCEASVKTANEMKYEEMVKIVFE